MSNSLRSRGAKWALLLAGVAVVVYLAMPMLESLNPAFSDGLEAMGQRDIPKAIGHLEKALDWAITDRHKARVLLLLGLAYQWNNQYEQAIQVANQVWELAPQMTADFPEQKISGLSAAGCLASLYRKTGQWAKALKWANRRLEQRPDAEVMMMIIEEAHRHLEQSDK